MRSISLAFLIGLFLINGPRAEISIQNLIESARVVADSELYDADYQFVKSNYHAANGPQLFYAAVVESHLGNEIDSLKYLISGQVRSTTDMLLFKPISESEEKLMAELYGMIFYQFGGAGGNEIYQDESRYSKVFENIRAYEPEIDTTYSPGWSHTGLPTTADYSSAISNSKEHRLTQLTDLVTLLENDEYVALSKELEELQEEPGGGGERALEIINKMREITGAPKVNIPK